jgi:adenosylcobinamide-phosphate synthase
MELLLMLGLAVALDLVFGEPPLAIHPVVWMGKVIAFLTKGGKDRGARVQFVIGIGIVLASVALFAGLTYLILFYLPGLNAIAYVIVGAVLLKTTFSLRELRRSALAIKTLLAQGKLPEARFELRALVGRDTAHLDDSLVISATVESVAENMCDSFTAPLFYFLFFGVPGAMAYRVINTLDAMIGHHGEYEYLGKFAAWLDTAVNYIPARITALLIILAAWMGRQDASRAWRIMLRDRGRTASPNAGWTMSAIAGALGVHLEKVGFYELGDSQNPLTLQSIDSSVQMITVAAIIWTVVILVAVAVYNVTT